MSIDPEGCEDIDDAFSCKQNDDGTVTLSVYIANVPVLVDHLELWHHIGSRVSLYIFPIEKDLCCLQLYLVVFVALNLAVTDNTVYGCHC